MAPILLNASYKAKIHVLKSRTHAHLINRDVLCRQALLDPEKQTNFATMSPLVIAGKTI